MRRSRALFVTAVLVLCVGCDHAAKQIARDTLGGAPVSLAGDTLRLELVQNPGAFLGLGTGLPPALRGPLLHLAAPLALLGVCIGILCRSRLSRSALLGLGLVAGGGGGNVLDRWLHGGAVTDFVSLGVGPLRTGIFNLADVCIVAGLALLLVSLREPGAPEGEPAADAG